MKVDYIICTLHWGDEYQSLPNKYQKNWEAFCYDQGADMVIGGHPHVLQPVEKKVVKGKEKLTAWSLGNYISNQRDRYKDGGMMLRATLCRDQGKVWLNEADYLLTWVHPRQEGITKPFYLLPDFGYNDFQPDFLTPENKQQMELFFADSRKLFADHNKNIREIKAEAIPGVAEIFRLYLEGYYSVWVEEQPVATFKTQLAPDLEPYFHPFTTANGTYVLLSGMCATLEQAFGNQRFLKDMGIANTKVVFIDPKTLSWRNAVQ
jgi:hypothetical protein